MSRYILVLVAGALCAQEREGRRGPEGGFMRFSPVLSALDADHDGVISQKEMKGASKALGAVDRNGDGQLTGDELRPAFGPGGPGGRGPGGAGRGGPGGGPGQDPAEMAAMVMRFDANGDGSVSEDEMPERMRGMFARGDANKDGKLTKDEVTALAKAQAGDAEQRGGGRGERGERKGFGGERKGPGGPGGPPRDPVFLALDADGDGAISAAEIANASAALGKADKNRDGQLTEDEVRPEFPGGFRGGPGRGERKGERF